MIAYPWSEIDPHGFQYNILTGVPNIFGATQAAVMVKEGKPAKWIKSE